jgi:5'-3' exonuclease
MGIPSYFSFIINNYANIIRNLAYFKNVQHIDNMYMDCNSIIYDAVHELNKGSEPTETDVFESKIINMVIVNIEKYILTISPSNSIFIAFDGVAPFAKMNQQKTRRYKTYFMSKTTPSQTRKWDTSAITPGTKFMERLSARLEHEFRFKEQKYKVKKIIVSTSSEKGEGEHKIMDYIRKENKTGENVALYGLDADLIMLSILQLKYCKNIYVFREAPEFLKSSIPVEVKSDASNLYFLDMQMFSKSLLSQMDCVNYDVQRICDYVFMCFLLGNDFLPHFPAMNIRTHGIQALMDIYKLYIGNKPECFFISRKNRIQWKNVGTFLKEVAKREHELLLSEYAVRDKFDKRNWPDGTPEEKSDLAQNVPVIYRAEEKYISPKDPGWERRYYKSLLHDENTKDVAMNYIEGLEWVYKYYSEGCPDWKWKYNYHYPPLFKDLVTFIPHFETDFIQENNHEAFTPEIQLSYVLPKEQLYLLPNKIERFLKTNYDELYPDAYDFQWAFCRYFWEAHPILPEVPIALLEQWQIQFEMNKT